MSDQPPIPLSEREPEFHRITGLCRFRRIVGFNCPRWERLYEKEFWETKEFYDAWLPDSPTAPEVVPETDVLASLKAQGLPILDCTMVTDDPASRAPASETPRTAAVHSKYEHLPWSKMYGYMHDHAEQLEKELAEARETNDRLLELVQQQSKSLGVIKDGECTLRRQLAESRPTAEQIEACAREIRQTYSPWSGEITPERAAVEKSIVTGSGQFCNSRLERRVAHRTDQCDREPCPRKQSQPSVRSGGFAMSARVQTLIRLLLTWCGSSVVNKPALGGFRFSENLFGQDRHFLVNDFVPLAAKLHVFRQGGLQLFGVGRSSQLLNNFPLRLDDGFRSGLRPFHGHDKRLCVGQFEFELGYLGLQFGKLWLRSLGAGRKSDNTKYNDGVFHGRIGWCWPANEKARTSANQREPTKSNCCQPAIVATTVQGFDSGSFGKRPPLVASLLSSTILAMRETAL